MKREREREGGEAGVACGSCKHLIAGEKLRNDENKEDFLAGKWKREE